MRRLLLLSLLALPLVGCATTSVGAGRQPAELQEVKARVLALQRQAAVADVEIERLRRQVAELELRLAGGAGVRAAPLPPVPATASPVPPAEVVPPLGLLDEAVPPPPPSVVEEEDLETAAVQVVEPLEPGAPVEAPVAAAPPEGLEAISSAAQAVYDRGYTLYHQGRYVDAETSFQEFLRDYPATELTDNAQYWIGECRFARGELEGALSAFRETVERFPAGNKVADALVKMGDCLRALGDEAGALARYQEVLDRFPGTGASAMAEARLP
jgi:tol-pal system protein YbgF